MPHCIPPGLPSGHPVRLVGRLHSHSLDNDTLIIEYRGHQCPVSTSAIAPQDWASITQVEVFGDLLVLGEDNLLVEARLVKSINEADLDIYERVVPILSELRAESKNLSISTV
jgi:hypothetical protein